MTPSYLICLPLQTRIPPSWAKGATHRSLKPQFLAFASKYLSLASPIIPSAIILSYHPPQIPPLHGAFQMSPLDSLFALRIISQLYVYLMVVVMVRLASPSPFHWRQRVSTVLPRSPFGPSETLDGPCDTGNAIQFCAVASLLIPTALTCSFHKCLPFKLSLTSAGTTLPYPSLCILFVFVF